MLARPSDRAVPFPSTRSLVSATRAMAASSQPLATLAAIRVLQEGGNAVDAAVTASVLLGVLEPMQAGLGGDVMALVYHAGSDRLYGLNASGRTPRQASAEAVIAEQPLGSRFMAMRSVHTVTVPGAVAGWCDLLERFGSVGIERALEPAIRAAEKGFAVAPHTAATWRAAETLIAQRPASARTWLTSSGSAPRPGERFVNPTLAASLRLIGEGGRDAFYRGPLAREIVRSLKGDGGQLTEEDFFRHASDWVEPLTARYRGVEIAQLPPSSQGIAVLEALALLERLYTPETRFPDPSMTHWQIEALKAALRDVSDHVSDPTALQVTSEWWLGPHRLDALASDIASRGRGSDRVRAAAGGDTALVCCADEQGNLVSLMASLFHPWGSGITAGQTGILLQNRGHSFSLDPLHPNGFGPAKRPRHTLLPAMLSLRDRPTAAFGFVGGDMQAQAQVQFLCNLIDHGFDLQQSLDAPRWRHEAESGAIALEALAGGLVEPLSGYGHTLASGDGFFGGGQAVAFDPELATFHGASDARRDGCALGL
jgi:gamma-glutamyltranspeptidase/glutathione hydrolase